MTATRLRCDDGPTAMTGSPVGGTGYDEWVNHLWVLSFPLFLVIAGIATLIDRIRNK